jgi:hypothetical protein
LVAGVGFEPTTSGPADEIGQLEKCQPDVGLIARDEEGKKEVVAGACNVPNALILPFRIELHRPAA